MEAESAIPVYPEDARRGAESAPVTLVAVLDLECPFCIRALPTLAALEEKYGPERLRLVVKHHPLPFHRMGAPAALAAIEVTQQGGSEAFFRFLGEVERGGELTAEKLAAWKAAALAGRTGPVRSSAAGSVPPSAQLGRDLAFAERAGARGTPTFFVNGILVSGAQPLEVFAAAIDAELAVAEAAARAGKPVTYAERVAVNFQAPPPEAPFEAEAPEVERTVWKVTAGRSPALGPPDALVTIVEFSDYQCPFCKRVHVTMRELLARYPADVRLVWKHHPLPFHAQARPAARLAEEARKRQGDAGFWRATEALLELPAGEMEPEALLRVAATLGLPRESTKKALEGDAHDAVIDADTELALDLEARGTPSFFVNGRRLSGAQPLEVFTALVDEELARARTMVESGVPRAAVYEKLMETAEGPPPPPKVDVGPVPAGRPSKGPAKAPVVILAFGDFQCPFCRRAAPTLDALMAEFPREVRIVWMNFPLDFHESARLAAAAALEMRRRGGDAAFFRLYELLMQPSTTLTDDDLADRIRRAGGDPVAILAAARDGRHEAAIAEDLELAKKAGIRGTPAFVINGYLVSGAQPLAAFRRAVRRALEDLAATPAR
jgi:protein-disulfide isomerase